MTHSVYTPQEVAAMSGAPLMAIKKAITAGKIPASVVGAAKRRQLDERALFAFALSYAMPAELHLSPAAAYQLLPQAQGDSDHGELAIGELVRVDVGRALAAVQQRLALYRRAKELIVSDPDTMGGAATIKGTRITAQAILGRVDDGDSVEAILEDYPYLDREAVEAAALYAEANPPRGRPSGQLWRRAS